ncbi:gamma-glutamyltransferase family protein [Thalassobaculum salexigens]|uniref:gamma-glutamyltransferase family protein n=1 Tax=Thalassobaculum salexigens TaxID=455360 RepID=UPI000424D2C5|nr:gamma-glutamyltransferase [Thalassobaculum salexigens]
MADVTYIAGRSPVRGVSGMVAAAHPSAAAAGAQVLREGGNAFDAIVATAAALNVCEPFMSGLAGNGLATMYIAKEKRVRSLDFTPPVPLEFDPSSTTKDEIAAGPKAPGVPGNLAGWNTINKTYGTRPLGELFKEAVRLARVGVPASAFYARLMDFCLDRNYPDLWRETYLDPLGKKAAGQVLRQPLLADTLEAIGSEGAGYLYGGPLGRTMTEHLQSIGGVISLEDLERVVPQFMEPMQVDYRGMTIHTVPPPAESFQMLLSLAMLSETDIGAMDHLGPDHLDTVFRSIRIASEMRLTYNKRPRAEVEALFEPAVMDRLRTRLTDGKPVIGRTEQWGAGPMSETDWTRQHTTSFSAADAEGNLICITQTLGGIFGSGVVIPGTGVCMSNYLNWGDLEPDSPNYLAPGKAWASVVAPSIGTVDGTGVLALGTPGSYGIMQTQTQAYVHYLDYGLDLQAAIEAPRARLWDGARVELESRVPEATVAELKRRGHTVEMAAPLTMNCGGMQAVSFTPETGAMVGAADPRRDGSAVPA